MPKDKFVLNKKSRFIRKQQTITKQATEEADLLVKTAIDLLGLGTALAPAIFFIAYLEEEAWLIFAIIV